MSRPEVFFNKCDEAAGRIREVCKERHNNILIVSHYDADGLTSASIASLMVLRLGGSFHIRIVHELDDKALEEVRQIGSDFVLFTDIGSGYIDKLESTFESRRVIVLDHHPAARASSSIPQVNPHDYGINGATEVSGAGVVYFVAKAALQSCPDLAALAVVGALGDMQDKNEKRTLRGLNDLVVADAQSAKKIETAFDLTLYGRETRPIHKSLAFTTTPYLPGLSGEEDNCLALVSSLGLPLKSADDRWVTVSDLSRSQKQKLMEGVIEQLKVRGFQAKVALDLIGTVYALPDEEPHSPTRDAREYSAALNACGRMGRPSVAVSLCFGDRTSAIAEVLELIAQYRKTLADYMRWLIETGGVVQELDAICVIRGEEKIDENMTGAFSSILSSAGHLKEGKATIVLTKSSSGGFKVSARAPERLLSLGVNLGDALHDLANKFGGIGGGHNVAAGAHILASDTESFISALNQKILNQMKSS